MEPIKTKGTIGPSSFTSIFPARKNVIMLVKLPIDAASLFVAMAVAGGSPTNNSAGNVISPPPPTIELIKAPINPKKNSAIIEKDLFPYIKPHSLLNK